MPGGTAGVWLLSMPAGDTEPAVGEADTHGRALNGGTRMDSLAMSASGIGYYSKFTEQGTFGRNLKARVCPVLLERCAFWFGFMADDELLACVLVKCMGVPHGVPPLHSRLEEPLLLRAAELVGCVTLESSRSTSYICGE